MKYSEEQIHALEKKLLLLESQLFEANAIVDAIRNGEVDALVLNTKGEPQIYALESADYTYRVLIEKFDQGALSLGYDGIILYCNDKFAALVNIPHQKLLGTNFCEYLHSCDSFQKILDDANRSGGRIELNLRSDNSPIPVNVSFSNLETVSAIGVVMTDLNDQKQYERTLLDIQRSLEEKVHELYTSNSNLEQFIHVISHDIKEPIRKILTHTSRLYETRPEALGDAHVNNLRVVNTSALRLDSLVDDLVRFAFSSKQEKPVAVPLKKVLSEVCDDLEILITENNAEIIVGNLPQIKGSKVQMRQLFSNLISNALKYRTPTQNPVVRISAEICKDIDSNEPDREYHKITVADNGIGMEEKYLEKIFTIFQRLHHRNEYSGNGIGLAICKKIMLNHEGDIDVVSKKNKGSVFNMYFPKQPSKTQDAKTKSE